MMAIEMKTVINTVINNVIYLLLINIFRFQRYLKIILNDGIDAKKGVNLV